MHAGIARFRVMEQRLFAIMSIGAVLAVLFGLAMVVASPAYLAMGWLRAKLLLVAALVGYHAWCYQLMLALRAGRGTHSARWYRMFNELPTLLLVAIVVLAVVKPLDLKQPPPWRMRATAGPVNHQIRTRSAGAMYILSPGLTSKAAYQTSRFGSGPFTRKRDGLCTSAITISRSVPSRYFSRHTCA